MKQKKHALFYAGWVQQMQLNKFQTRFKDLMLDHPDALNAPPEDLTAFCEVGEIDLPTRLKVYRNNIVGSLTDVMVATFPIIDNLVGREFLELMARGFILENPPNHGCLSLYGDGFEKFIDGFELAKSLPYLPDVARFELALNKTYYAADDLPLTTEGLGIIPPDELENARIPLRDHVHLVQSRFPLTAIRDFCMAETQDKTLSLDQGGVFLMIYRSGIDTQTLEISESEHFMLEQLLAEKPLGEAVETTLNSYQDFDFQDFLQKHLSLETFKAF